MAFTTVTAVRSSEGVVRQIEAHVRAGGLRRGQKLPSERELSEQFGVSRGIVREAIKLLEGSGMLESRHGSGVYLASDPTPMISRALTFSVTPDDASVRALFAFREELEAVAVRFAAQQTDAEAFAGVYTALDANSRAVAAQDWDAFSETDMHLHAAIAEAAHNPYLAAVVGATRQMQREVMWLFAQHAGTLPTAQVQHTEIVAAIVAGDADRAERAMRDHVQYTALSVRQVLDALQHPTTNTTNAHTQATGGATMPAPTPDTNMHMDTRTA